MTGKVNRFNSFSKTWLGGILLYSLIIFVILLSIEFFSYGVALLYLKLKDRNLEVANNQFLIGHIFSNNPINENTNAHYLGHMGGFKSIRGWHIADPLLGWRLGKNVGITLHHLHAEDIEWQVTNEQGFMASDSLSFYVNPEKPPGVFRIFIFGGSTVAGIGSKTPLENLPAQFSQLIKKTAKPAGTFTNFEVINAGVSGYNSSHEFLYFITEIINYDPDLVIFYNGWNDQSFWEAQLRLSPNYLFPKRHTKHTDWAKRLNESFTFPGAVWHVFLSIQSVVYEYSHQIATLWAIKSSLKRVLSKIIPASDLQSSMDKTKDNETSPYPLKAVQFYENNLRDSINFALSRKVKVAEFLQPLVGLDKKVYFKEAQERVNSNPTELQALKKFYYSARNMIEELSNDYKNQENACIADLSFSLENEKERLYADAEGHLLQKGNAIIARNIRDHLIRCGILAMRSK